MTENKSRFMLWDFYEDYGYIGGYDTLEAAQSAAGEWQEDTDGECDVRILEWDAFSHGYKAIDF